MRNTIVEVKWTRADVSPEEADKRLRAAFKLILDAQAHTESRLVSGTEWQATETMSTERLRERVA